MNRARAATLGALCVGVAAAVAWGLAYPQNSPVTSVLRAVADVRSRGRAGSARRPRVRRRALPRPVGRSGGAPADRGVGGVGDRRTRPPARRRGGGGGIVGRPGRRAHDVGLRRRHRGRPGWAGVPCRCRGGVRGRAGLARKRASEFDHGCRRRRRRSHRRGGPQPGRAPVREHVGRRRGRRARAGRSAVVWFVGGVGADGDPPRSMGQGAATLFADRAGVRRPAGAVRPGRRRRDAEFPHRSPWHRVRTSTGRKGARHGCPGGAGGTKSFGVVARGTVSSRHLPGVANRDLGSSWRSWRLP